MFGATLLVPLLTNLPPATTLFSRVYSTAAYWGAAVVALLLSFSPKFGEAIATVSQGVLGGAGTVLYGMIGHLGAKIRIEAQVDFGNPINLMTGALALITRAVPDPMLPADDGSLGHG